MTLTTEDFHRIAQVIETAIGTRVTAIVEAKASTLVTKDDLNWMATKTDLVGLVTKSDLDRMESRLTTAMSLLERDTSSRLDQHEARISRLERAG